MRRFTLMVVACLIAAPAIASEKSGSTRLQAAEEVLKASVTAPDKGIPNELFERAECIGVFPGVKKGAFVVGGEFGKGVFTCRQKDGSMGAPAFFDIGGASVGWQFGGEEADIILLVMNPDGVSHLLEDKFSIGGEATAAAGPVGRTAKAATDAQLHAQILSWSRSRGLFLGASLEGTVIKPDKDDTTEFYGKPVTAKELLVDQSVPVPGKAQSYVSAVSRQSRRAS